ncbi:uncharacterized protein LOC133887967 [Phragmites australis]|uniref:uncharacterized protein LOC133887967 n=1 Tax=Phragmites australis TaxID=29695 RepID=UPI002D797B96|nr:uncharacterized protein LOC133887967 [Phragmites australis]
MDRAPATQGRRANAVVGRKLDELCACLDDALSSPRPRCPEALHAEIKARTDFLQSLLAAEAECYGGAPPLYLAEAEERFAVLKNAFHQWARGAVAARAEEEEGEHGEEATGSGSECSCTDSCQEAAVGDAECDAVEARKEVTSDAVAMKRDAECEAMVTREKVTSSDAIAKNRDAEGGTMGTREEVTSDAIAKNRDAENEAAAETRRSNVQRRWRRSAAWCGIAGVVAVVAVGLAVELAAVAHHNVNVYVVPT